jgi:hypothetical protein
MSRTRHVAAEDEDAASAANLDDPVERAEWLEEKLCEIFEMPAEDARRISGLVIDQFGSKDEVLDDQIPKEVRSVFYTLESERILTFRRIEYEGEDGMTKRGFFWCFHPDQTEEETAAEEETQSESVYDELDEDVWSRGAAA